MTHQKHWSVDVFIDEHDSEATYAEARLHTQDDTHLMGKGRARRNPRDAEVPEIGDELAAARALSDLAHSLLDAAVNDIEAITHRPVHLKS